MREDLLSWGDHVGVESRKSFKRKLDNCLFKKNMSGNVVIDIGYRGYVPGVTPILPHAIGIDTDFPDYDGEHLSFEDNSVDAVYSSHCLERIRNSTHAIREWRRVLKVGGFLIIAVPHRDLYQKANLLAVARSADHQRHYTPSSLLHEIESALRPNSFRLRELHDDGEHYDYTIGPKRHTSGNYEIEVVVEKIEQPRCLSN